MLGEVEVGLVGWWWRDEDHRPFTDWANREAPGFFHSLAFHLPYGTTAYAARPIAAGTRERAFVHISFGEKDNRDAYGHYGAAPAPARLETTARNLVARGAEGYCAYSEGVYDDLNKALLAGLTSGQFAAADEVMTAYAHRYFSDDDDAWCEWLRLLADYFAPDHARARALFDRLKPRARPGRRSQQLEERLIMAEADAAVRSRPAWDADRLAAAEAFWAAKERLYRDVWRLGLTRHAFRFDGYAPDWHESYLQARGIGAAHNPLALRMET